MKQALLDLLREFKDVLRLHERCLDLIHSWLRINSISKKGTRPVKKALKDFKSELAVKIKQEIDKLFDVGLIKPI